jgi:hypothetical protein
LQRQYDIVDEENCEVDWDCGDNPHSTDYNTRRVTLFTTRAKLGGKKSGCRRLGENRHGDNSGSRESGIFP